MSSALDRGVLRVTRRLHRVCPSLPVLEKWPGMGRLGAGMYWRTVRPAYEHVMARLAALHRARLPGVVFIGVTGSAAKTTTKDLIGAVLSTTFRGPTGQGSGNYPHDVVRNILTTRSRDQFRIVEIGANTGPGSLDAPLALLRPDVGVVTNVHTDHYSAFGSVDAIAAEKRKLVDVLPATGTAVLNADDPRVLAMRDRFPGRVLTFGMSPEASVRAEGITAAWPDRLAFVLIHDGRRVPVQTQLCGAHWVSAALAATAVGVALGVSLEAAAQALGRVAPFHGRMSPVALPDGVTFIRDDWKASVHTIPPALDFMKGARASRKVAIIGTIADTMGDAGAIYVSMAKRAVASTDLVCFVGPRASSALRAKTHAGDDRIRAFATVRAAAEFMKTFLRPGDLVLLKGSNTADHLYRIILARTSGVACWRANCMKDGFCNTCSLRDVPSEVDDPGTPGVGSIEMTAGDRDASAPSHVIVGLGNPGARYEGTPHNVGRAVVDRLAATLGTTWEREADADVSRTEWKGEVVCLVKPTSVMNRTGPVLARLAQRLRVDQARCILVYDDLDLPLGSIRTRMRGSDGGHRGVRSIIEAFQTDQLRRVKIGVRRPGDTRDAGDAVLAPFTGDEARLMAAAYEQAIARLGELVVRPQAVTERAG